MDIRVLVAGHLPLIRMGLVRLLEELPRVTVVGEAADGEETLQRVAELSPDLVMLDLNLPGGESLEIIGRIHKVRAETKVVAMSPESTRHQAADALRAGARGYLLKTCAVEEVGMAVRSVMSGSIYLSPRVAELIMDHYVHGEEESHPSLRRTLTEREQRILQLVADGLTSKEIAQSLLLSVKTVDTHRQQIMSKLGIRSIARLTKYAVREGLSNLELEPS